MPPAAWAKFLEGSRGFLQPRTINTTDPITVSDYLGAQWLNPGDILSILLLLGPDIVQGAVAQMAGRTITPVAFSFGWVAYAASALLNAVGDGCLMPDTEMVNTLVIGAVSGHIRTTKTWILGRLLRDGDDLVDKEMDDREEAHIPPSATPSSIASSQDQLKGKAKDRPWEALRVSVFEVIPGAPHGVPTRDWVWWSGYVIIIVQLAISIIPWIKSQEWGTFMIAGVGNFLALLEGSLPQWRREKWACPKTGGATVTITQGNGSRHAMVILQSRGKGLDIEILAQGTRTKKASTFTRVSTAVLALLWIALLGTVSGLKIDTWYLLGIGLLGSIQNVVAAGAPRSPSAMGFHIRLVETITGSSVARVLRETESKYQFVGTSLVQVFFPGSLRVKEEDIDFWREAQDQRLRPNKWGARIDNLPEKEKVDGYEDLSEIQPGNGVWKRGLKFESQEVRDSYL